MKCKNCGKETIVKDSGFCDECEKDIYDGEKDLNKKKGESIILLYIKSKLNIAISIIFILIYILFIKMQEFNFIETTEIVLIGYIVISAFMATLWIMDNSIKKNSINEKNEHNELDIHTSNTEYRKKCNICGNIFCYTDEDIKKNNEKIKEARRYAIQMVTQGLVGNNKIDWRYNQQKAEQQMNEVIDYSKCPHCGSTDITDYDKVEQKVNTVPQQVDGISEIKKYKELLDEGIITQEEFEKKKQELLDL